MSKFLVYKSSAGSGKTSTLVEIFLKLSLNSQDARHYKKLLAITFTNKAAGEMKDRFIEELDHLRNISNPYTGSNHIIHNLLNSLGIKPQKDTNLILNQSREPIAADALAERARRMLQVVLHDYSDLSISTIDRFNHQLIRSFSHDLGLKSDFEVEMDVDNLFREAVDRLVAKVGMDDQITNHLLGYMALKMDDEKSADIMEDLVGMKNLVMNESGVEALQDFKNDEQLDFLKIKNELIAIMRRSREAICRKGEEAILFLQSTGLQPNDFLGKSKGIWSFCEKVKGFKNDELKITANVLKGLDGEFVTKTASAALKSSVDAISDQLVSVLRGCVSAIEEHQETFFMSRALLMQIDLLAVLEELSSCLDEICEERNILPISYFNRLISEALRKESVAYLYENYGVRFDHVLIDEFQDTSELQWFNILPLIDESVGKGKVSMVVGDAKQSIYRWRGGKAEQLINLPLIDGAPSDLEWVAHRVKDITCIADPLNTNYRTRANIVEFNNAVFSALGAALTAPQSLYCTEYLAQNVSQKTTSGRPGGYIRIEQVGSINDDYSKWNNLLENINRFKEAGYQYKDMAILVRSAASEGRQIVDYLTENDIPVSTAESFEIDKDTEVQLVMAFMRLSFDPGNVQAQITVMRSMESIFNLEFAPHKFVSKTGHYADGFRIAAFLKSHNLPVFYSRHGEGIYEMAQRIISTYVPQSKNNFLTALLNVIVANAGLNGTCAQFFEWWDALYLKPSAPPNAGRDAVQLSTIHRAKGLEFPIVLIPDVSWKKRAVNNELKWFNLSNKNHLPIRYAPLALNSRLKNIGLEEEWNKEEQENDFDNLNLLYVALTRPVHAMYIGYHKMDSGRMSKHFQEAIEALHEEVLSTMPQYRFQNLEEAGQVIEIGEIPPPPETKIAAPRGVAIPKAATDSKPWYNKVNVSRQMQDAERLRGVRFHKMVSVSPTAQDAQRLLQKWTDDGVITISEQNELSIMAADLYADKQFINLLEGGTILAEREIMHHNTVLRPDLVVNTGTKTVVIDLKTGTPDANHHTQVKKYAEALGQITTQPLAAYILYVQPVQWVQVEPGQSTLF